MSEFTEGLRAMADWFEKNPDHEVSYNVVYLSPPSGSYDDSGNWHDTPQEKQTEWLRAIAKSFGSCEKKASYGTFTVIKDFGGGVRIRAESDYYSH